MASLKKRNGYYSIVFKTHVEGKQVLKAYALGTRHKKIAEQKKLQYEKLYQKGEINPFSDNWNLKEFEKARELEGTSITSPIIDDLRDEFLKEKTNYIKKTKQTYEYIINRFIKQVGQTISIVRVNEEDIRKFCIRDDLAIASQKNYLGHLKTFFNWIVEKGYIDENPCHKVQTPRRRNNLVEKIIEEDQLQVLFKAFRVHQLEQKKAGAISKPTQMQFWFKPLITLAFYTGLRRKEIAQLQWEHIHFKERYLRVTNTKNGEERTVPIFDPVYYRLLAWKKFMGNPEKGSVFLSPKSTPKNQIPLMGETASRRFRFYADKAKFKDTINFHGLRHSCATFLLRQGFNVIEVKNMLGHKSIEITNRYVHLVANDLLASANRNGLISGN